MTSLRDEASGLFSWDAFVAIAEMLIALTKRRSGEISLLLVGVDEPATVPGDLAVRLLAQQAVRASDTVGRHGEYSVAMLASDASPDGALHLVERIRGSLSDAEDTRDGGVPFRVSIGIATFMQEDEGLEDLLQRAQSALAEAIEAGGNQMRFSNRIVDSQSAEEEGSAK